VESLRAGQIGRPTWFVVRTMLPKVRDGDPQRAIPLIGFVREAPNSTKFAGAVPSSQWGLDPPGDLCRFGYCSVFESRA